MSLHNPDFFATFSSKLIEEINKKFTDIVKIVSDKIDKFNADIEKLKQSYSLRWKNLPKRLTSWSNTVEETVSEFLVLKRVKGKTLLTAVFVDQLKINSFVSDCIDRAYRVGKPRYNIPSPRAIVAATS